MKTKSLLKAMVIPLGFILAGTVSAVDVDLVTMDTSYPSRGGTGGPFYATPTEGGPLAIGTTFITFCVEKEQNISLGKTPYRYQLSTKVLDRGLDPAGTDLSFDTASLYSAFRAGTISSKHLDDASFDYTDVNDLMELQEAIYTLEYGDAADGFALLLVSEARAYNWDNYENVRVMNLGSVGGTDWGHQDQLAIVPIPAAAWLFGSGLIGLAAIRRRKTA